MMPERATRWERCPVEGCPHSRQRSQMMCRACWRRVSPPTQAAVYRAWRKAKNADDLGGKEWGDYFAIRTQAIREAEA